ncbi:hypothetical protein Leryth_005047 [Lithospermum erythrorhizon]|nr:hypothetical protein Leryth_005047 [Lithospermum erythrorhizon]
MNTTLAYKPIIYHIPLSNLDKYYEKCPLFKPRLSTATTSLTTTCCLNNENSQESPSGFSLLKSDVSCNSGSLWSTLAFYIFSLHIPLSFGGVSAVGSVFHQRVVDPQTQALSILIIESVEFIGFLLLLRFSHNQVELLDCFKPKKLLKERSWILASILGFGFIVLALFLTSILADQLIGPKDVNNPVLRDMLSGGEISVTACILLYCVVTPILEESVYRAFLLTSLSSTMTWKQSVIISSLIFSASHFSGENFLQLFVIGIVLGCSYCWSGNLSSSIAIHSLYNALILYVTYVS